MKLEKKQLLCSGKTKSLYATNENDWLIAEFRDDITAFDAQKHEQLSNKGIVNNKISTHIMQVLAAGGVPTHFKATLSPNEAIVRRLNMFPLENVIRNIAAGSLCKRLGVTSGKTMSPPLYELFYKDDELHDPLVTRNHALCFGWATQDQLDQMEAMTIKINAILTDMFLQAGLVLVDAKYEFGVGSDGKIYLGDEISPDSCRIWDKVTHEPFDKDRFRKDLGNVMSSYQHIAELLGVE
jgi:phosphoribosylaminoimidazole-succinocarboxamide synthase